MLESDNVKVMHNLLIDSLPLNNKKQDTYTKLSDLTQKCKDVNDNNTLVSISNDNDLTSFIKASVGISSRTVHNFSHETNLSKKMGSRINKKLEVKFEIRCGAYFSNYKALSENEHHFRKVNNIKDYVIKTNPTYVHNRQHDKETFDNSVLDDNNCFNPNFVIKIDPILENLKSVSNDEEISMDDKVHTANNLLEQKIHDSPYIRIKNWIPCNYQSDFWQDNSYVF